MSTCCGEGDRLSAGRRKRDSALGESVAHIQTLLLVFVMNMLLAFLRFFLISVDSLETWF